MKIKETKTVPKKSVAKLSISEVENNIDEVFEWIRDNINGTVWWMKTQYRDPTTGRQFAPSYQRNFKDGYYVYTFLFSSKTDAAKFILAWR